VLSPMWVLSSDPLLSELALRPAPPWWRWVRSGDSLPARQGVQGVGEAGSLDQLGVTEVLKALGLRLAGSSVFPRLLRSTASADAPLPENVPTPLQPPPTAVAAPSATLADRRWFQLASWSTSARSATGSSRLGLGEFLLGMG